METSNVVFHLKTDVTSNSTITNFNLIIYFPSHLKYELLFYTCYQISSLVFQNSQRESKKYCPSTFDIEGGLWVVTKSKGLSFCVGFVFVEEVRYSNKTA